MTRAGFLAACVGLVTGGSAIGRSEAAEACHTGSPTALTELELAMYHGVSCDWRNYFEIFVASGINGSSFCDDAYDALMKLDRLGIVEENPGIVGANYRQWRLV